MPVARWPSELVPRLWDCARSIPATFDWQIDPTEPISRPALAGNVTRFLWLSFWQVSQPRLTPDGPFLASGDGKITR